MRILTRYLLRLHVAPFLFAATGLTLLMLLDQVSRRFKDLIGKDLHWTVIVEVFVYSVPFILAQTLPMAVLIAVLYTFNRLAGDFEITAIRASGIPLVRVMIPLLVAATLLAGAMTWFNNTILPESNHHLQTLLTSIGQKKPTFYLRERAINEVVPSRLYVQPGRIDRERSALEDAVLYDEREQRRSRTIYADSGRMAFDESGEDLYLTLYDGTLQERPDDKPGSFQRMRFGRMMMRVEGVANHLERDTLSSFRSDREMDIAQMQTRVRAGLEQVEEARSQSRAYAVALTRKLVDWSEPLESEAATDSATAVADSAAVETLPVAEGAPPDTPAARSAADAARARTRADAQRDEVPARSGAETPGRESAEIPGPENVEPPAPQDTGSDATAGDSVAAADSAAAAESRATRERLRNEVRSAVARYGHPAEAVTQLENFAGREDRGLGEVNQFRVEIHKKGSIPVACIVFVLIGAPIAVRYPRAGVALVVGVSLLFFGAYYVSLVGGEELADRRFISPVWAMWAPNVLFGAIGLAFLWQARRVTR